MRIFRELWAVRVWVCFFFICLLSDVRLAIILFAELYCFNKFYCWLDAGWFHVVATVFLPARAGAFVTFILPICHGNYGLNFYIGKKTSREKTEYISKQKSGYLFNAIILIILFYIVNVLTNSFAVTVLCVYVWEWKSVLNCMRMIKAT